MLFSACEKFNNEDITKGNYLVDKIYSYDDYLVAEYFYDKGYRLTKKSVTEHLGNDYKQEWTAYTDEFKYQNGRVSKIIHKDVTNNMFNYETDVFYDKQGQLIRTEVHIAGLLDSRLDYRYENGHIVGFSNKNGDPNFITDTMVYDKSDNVIKHIHIIQELDLMGHPIPGATKRIENFFNYDNNQKPNFGLNYLFIYEPLPFSEEAELERHLSKNNMIECGGSTWIYTFNEDGLPSTIEVKWNGIETDVPKLLKITYKIIE
jgi:hypothetical protein